MAPSGTPRPRHAVISTVTLNQKNSYVLATREDCPATTVLEYEETVQTALHEIDNATTAMKPQETWAKATIHGINIGAYPDDPVGMTLLRAEIETHNPSASLTTLPRSILDSSTVRPVQILPGLRTPLETMQTSPRCHLCGNKHKTESTHAPYAPLPAGRGARTPF